MAVTAAQVKELRDKNGAVQFSVGDYAFSISSPECVTLIKNDTWSPSFGMLRNNKTIDFKFKFDNNINLSTMVLWTKTGNTK